MPSRRTLLCGLAVALPSVLAGCSGVTDDALTSPPSATGTPATSPSSSPDTPTSTARPPAETPTLPLPHPLDLLLENHASDPHRLTVRIEDRSGTVVLAETDALAAREERTIPAALPAAVDERTDYRVTARREGGSRVEQTISFGPVHEVHLLAVFVTDDGEVAIDQRYH